MTKIRDYKPQKHEKYMIQFGSSKLKYTFIGELFCKTTGYTKYIFVAENNDNGYYMATLFGEWDDIEEVEDEA